MRKQRTSSTACTSFKKVSLLSLLIKTSALIAKFTSIQNMERLKQMNMKKEIEEKDGKIEKLKIKREREILDCRAQAHYTAELREQLRYSRSNYDFQITFH